MNTFSEAFGMLPAPEGMLLLGWIPGHMELIIVAIIALLLFGHRLPSMMRGLGQGIKEFKHGMNAEDDEEEDEVPPPKKAVNKKKAVPSDPIEEEEDEPVAK